MIDPEEKQRLLDEKQALENDNDRLWNTALKLESSTAFKKAKSEMKNNDERIRKVEARLKQLDETITPEERDRRIANALNAIKEGTFRTKKHCLRS